jgi:undecaprenyl-diphosphatase
VTIGQAIGLGALQGLTEFLPVSSSGHLVLANGLFGIQEPNAVGFVVLVHAGSLLAILAFFWREILSLFTTRRRLIPWLIVGTIPAGIAYVALKDPIEGLFQNPSAVGVALLVTGTVLVVSERLAREVRSLDEVSWKDAVVVGVAQSLALVPGISRSGMTVSSGLASGLRRPAAVAFAFLLGAAAIGGGTVGKAKDFVEMGAQAGWAPLAAGFAASLVVSLGSLWLLSVVVKRRCLKWFGVYCYVVGLGVIVARLAGWWPGA